MPRQIDDNEYNFLQSRRQVADFVESIYNDPALAKEAKALIKKKYPGLAIPDYDIEQKVEQRFEEERQQRDTEAEERKRRDEDEKFRKLRKKTQDDYGFTDDAMTRLEQMMIDRNIGDYEAGAALMAAREPKAADATQGSQFWRHQDNDTFKEISKDPEKWAEREIMGAIRADQERDRGRNF